MLELKNISVSFRSENQENGFGQPEPKYCRIFRFS